MPVAWEAPQLDPGPKTAGFTRHEQQFRAAVVLVTHALHAEGVTSIRTVQASALIEAMVTQMLVEGIIQ